MAIVLLLLGIGLAFHGVGRVERPVLAIASAAGLDRDVSRAGAMVPVEWETMESSAAALMADSAEESSGGGGLAGLSGIEGWNAGELESFDTENLYEKINGRAEAYLTFGFQRLDCVSFTKGDDEAEFVDVYGFDHGNELNAFGIYASERPPEPVSMKIGREGYLAGGTLCFWKGTQYVQVIASSESEETLAVAETVARRVEATIEDSGAPLEGIDQLPADGQVPATLQYLVASALSQEFLDRTFTAMYDAGPDQRLRLFVTRRASADEANDLLSKYKAYLGKYSTPLDLTIEGTNAASGDMAGTIELVFVEGPFFAGVTEAPSKEAAQTFAARLRDHLKALEGS